MENNPRKSKALIITFIVVLGLLVGMYYVFSKPELFGVDNSIGKRFAPLLGTNKQKDLNPIENPDALNNTSTNTNNSNDTGGDNNTDTSNNDQNQVFVGASNLGAYSLPSAGSVSLPGNPGQATQSNFKAQCSDGTDNDDDSLIDDKDPGCHSDGDPKNTKTYNKNQYLEYNFIPQCSDGVDNDKDKLTDDKDPECHSDGNAKNVNTYTPAYSSEYTKQTKNTNTIDQCTQEEIPLTFTAEEQKQLDELTRQFYRLASVLKSPEDVIAEERTAQSYESLVTDAITLTKECYEQTYNDTYLRNANVITGPENWVRPITYQKEVKDLKADTGETKSKVLRLNIDGVGLYDNPINLPSWALSSKSGLDKGRTERRNNPYTPFTKKGSSYYQLYWTDDTTKQDVYPWSIWEDTFGVW